MSWVSFLDLDAFLKSLVNELLLTPPWLFENFTNKNIMKNNMAVIVIALLSIAPPKSNKSIPEIKNAQVLPACFLTRKNKTTANSIDGKSEFLVTKVSINF